MNLSIIRVRVSCVSFKYPSNVFALFLRQSLASSETRSVNLQLTGHSLLYFLTAHTFLRVDNSGE